jgi:hypothetical protein
MSVLTKSQFDTIYNSSGSGTFLDNSTQSIVEASMRAFAKDIEDSFFNLSDNKYSGAAGVYLNITDTTGLKAIVTVGVSVGFIIFYRDSSGNLNSYKLLAGTDAESLPDIVRPTDYAGGTNEKVWKIANFVSGSITGTFTVKKSITSGQILSAYSSPIELVAAPGANKIIIPISCITRMTYGTTPYATNVNARLGWDSGTSGTAVLVQSLGLINTSANNTLFVPINSSSSYSSLTSYVNKNFCFSIGTGNPTAGDSPIQVSLVYTIIDIS